MVMTTYAVQCWEVLESVYNGRAIRTHALNVGTGSGDYEERHENDKHNLPVDRQHIGSSSELYVIFIFSFFV